MWLPMAWIGRVYSSAYFLEPPYTWAKAFVMLQSPYGGWYLCVSGLMSVYRTLISYSSAGRISAFSCGGKTAAFRIEAKHAFVSLPGRGI